MATSFSFFIFGFILSFIWFETFPLVVVVIWSAGESLTDSVSPLWYGSASGHHPSDTGLRSSPLWWCDSVRSHYPSSILLCSDSLLHLVTGSFFSSSCFSSGMMLDTTRGAHFRTDFRAKFTSGFIASTTRFVSRMVSSHARRVDGP